MLPTMHGAAASGGEAGSVRNTAELGVSAGGLGKEEKQYNAEP